LTECCNGACASGVGGRRTLRALLWLSANACHLQRVALVPQAHQRPSSYSTTSALTGTVGKKSVTCGLASSTSQIVASSINPPPHPLLFPFFVIPPCLTGMSDHLKRILQLDAKFLRTLDMVDPSIYSFDETTKNYLRFADYKFKTGQLKKRDRQGVSKETERNLLRVVDCGSARTISRIWEILAESDPLEVASAAVKDVDIPDELLLGHSGNKDTEPLSILKTKMKVTSKGKGKQKGRKERKLRHAKTQFVAKRNFEEWPTPSHSDEGNMMNASTDELAYTKFEFASNRSSKNKHRKRGSFAVDNLVGRRYGSLLRKVEKRQEKLESLQQKDPAKAEVATRKICWDTAEKRAQGVKIKDDPSLLKKSLKRRLKKKERSRTKWAQRVAAVERAMQKKQEIRLKNIRRIEQKKKFRAKEHL
ncbi:hypothetical protein M514_12249, partial [Trichuris suis]